MNGDRHMTVLKGRRMGEEEGEQKGGRGIVFTQRSEGACSCQEVNRGTPVHSGEKKKLQEALLRTP